MVPDFHKQSLSSNDVTTQTALRGRTGASTLSTLIKQRKNLHAGTWAVLTAFYFLITYKWPLQAKVFVTGRPYKPTLMFTGMARFYLFGAPYRCSTPGLASSLTHKFQTWQEKPARNNHSNLLDPFVSYAEKNVVNMAPGAIEVLGVFYS